MSPLELENGTLFYQLTGDGPPLVLIHAGIADSSMWDAQVEPFTERFQVLRYDMRGFGASPLPDGPFSHYDDLRTLIEALELPPVWLVAVSFGASVALDFALSSLERVRGLVLVSPTVSGFASTPELEAFGSEEDALLEAGKLEEATELNLRMWVDGPWRTSAEVNPHVRVRVGKMQHRTFAQPVPAGAALQNLTPPASERLHELQVPTLIVSGALDVPSFLAYARRLEAGIPSARRVELSGVAHLPSMEQAKAFNQRVLAFVDENSPR